MMNVKQATGGWLIMTLCISVAIAIAEPQGGTNMNEAVSINPTWVLEAIPSGPDPACGAAIVQLTSEPVTSTNVYCEQRFASADGSRIAIERRPFGQPPELWVCDLTTLRLCRIAPGRALAANAPRNAVYYIDSDDRLMRLDMKAMTLRELVRFGAGEAPRVGTVSPDERWLVSGPFPVRDNIYALRRTDLTNGQTVTLCEMEDIINPHLQFELAAGRTVMVQINRGGSMATGTADRRLSGPLGATLAAVDVMTGNVVPMPAGVPHTPLISGHESWAGPSGRVVFTTAPTTHPTLIATTGVYSATPGAEQATPIALGRPVNHLAVSDDGRFFIVDEYQTWRLYVGSVETGRMELLCDSHTRQGKPQYTHAHAYMTPDNRFVIYVSNVTGVSQVYSARIPDGFLDKLLVPRDGGNAQ